ncbi:MAG: hypothetical protein Q9184_000767, partial [Pyrenodesmia sp. 2 TL-2023]
MPTTNIYIVNSLDLVSSVQRLHEQLSFRPFEAKFASRLCASSKEANDILEASLDRKHGDQAYSHEMYKLMHPALAPGAGLDGLNHAASQDIAKALERLRAPGDRSKRIRLAEWSRHEITMATTNAVYGNQNPFRSPEVEKAFWYVYGQQLFFVTQHN